MAKKGKKGRRSKPILGVATVAALGMGLLTNKAGYPHSALEYAMLGNGRDAMTVLGKAVGDAKSYMPALVPGAGWVVLSFTKVGKRKVFGNWSLA